MDSELIAINIIFSPILHVVGTPECSTSLIDVTPFLNLKNQSDG
jgi:hypothetical protein